MAKLIHTNLLGEEIPQPEPISQSGKTGTVKKRGSKKGRKLYMAVAGAALVILIAMGGFILLSKYVGSGPEIIENVERPVPVPRPRSGHKPVKINADTTDTRPVGEAHPARTRPKGLSGIPWMGAVAEVIGAISETADGIYSLTSGPEGVVILCGRTTNEASIDSTILALKLKNPKTLSTKQIEGKTEYIAYAGLVPLERIDFDPVPVPPYERGQILRELDSLAHVAGLRDIRSEALGRDEIPGGSRFLISISCRGGLDGIISFIGAVNSRQRMIEIGRFSLEGISGKSLTEEELKAGFIFRIYDLPPVGPAKDIPSPV